MRSGRGGVRCCEVGTWGRKASDREDWYDVHATCGVCVLLNIVDYSPTIERIRATLVGHRRRRSVLDHLGHVEYLYKGK